MKIEPFKAWVICKGDDPNCVLRICTSRSEAEIRSRNHASQRIIPVLISPLPKSAAKRKAKDELKTGSFSDALKNIWEAGGKAWDHSRMESK